MTKKARKLTLRAVKTPPDASDFASLWSDPALGDGIVDTHFHTVPVDKPKDFFRTHPNKDYRRRCEIYTHKIEGVVGETHYIIAPSMQGRILEARPCTLVCVVYRDGTPRLWPIKMPRDGERDNEAWRTARIAAHIGLAKWIKILWVGRAYETRAAQPGYAPDPDWDRLPPFEELVRTGLGEHGIVRDTNHPIYRELFGLKNAEDGSDGGEL
jgi:hypothetical protein